MTSYITYADLEIRILNREEAGYPVEITLNNERQFKRGYLAPRPEKESWDSILDPVAAGQELFEWFLIDSNLKEAWGQVREQRPHRIRLRIDREAPELHAIPWELLQEPGQGELSHNLAQSIETPFSRYLSGIWHPGNPILKRPLKMLIAIANPKDLEAGYRLSPIDVDKEWALIEAVTQGMAVTCDFLSQPCTLSALEDQLKTGYHILHFIGHGNYSKKRGEASLYMADEDNEVVLVKEADFAAMLASQVASSDIQSEDKLRLVFLASCQTANRSPADAFRGFAPCLVDAGVPAVLAMQELVPVDTVRTFTRTFYQQLLVHGLVDRASNEARAKVQTEQKSGPAIPVLFMRLQEGQLFATPGRDFEREEFEPKTVYISAGQFWMGSEEGEDGARQYEKPRHQVYVDHFRIGQYPITNRQYAYFVWDKNYRAPTTNWRGQRPAADKMEHPVMGVSWYDALEYCRWLSDKTKRLYRLPSEAEWEKVARGDSNAAPYPWGEWQEDRCNFERTEAAAVDAFPAQSLCGGYELFDLVGNVPEWTLSLWGQSLSPDPEYFYPWDKNVDRNTLHASSKVFRIYRGGSYINSSAKRLRCAARRGAAPESKVDEFGMEFGFRVVLEVEESNNE